MRKMKTFTLFENQKLQTGRRYDGEKFSEKDLQELIDFKEGSVPYFSMIRNGIQFHNYAGIIQTERLRIEVLPRADRSFAGPDEKTVWRKIFIQMISFTGVFSGRIRNVSSKNPSSYSAVDLLLDTFLRETEYILHSGFTRQYHTSEGNSNSLKGRLIFSRHIQKNSVHHEKFYTEKYDYDKINILNIILYKALLSVKRLNSRKDLSGRIESLILNFPEMPDIKVSSSLFDKISFSRKNIHYKNCIETARMILLNDRTDQKQGRNSGFAMMTEMNDLWKHFVLRSIRKHKKRNFSISGHTSKSLWKSENLKKRIIKPDIILNKGRKNCIVLEAKWKSAPSDEDFSRLYASVESFGADKTAFILPGTKSVKGLFADSGGIKPDKICSILKIPADIHTEEWEKNIFNQLLDWID